MVDGIKPEVLEKYLEKEDQIKKYIKTFSRSKDISYSAAVSFIPDALCEYNADKSEKDNFVQFVSIRAVYRAIDNKKRLGMIHQSLHYNPCDNKNYFEEVDWEDEKAAILKAVDDFGDSTADKIRQSLIVDNIIPKCSGEHYLSYSQIASMFHVTPACVSILANDSKMKTFFKRFFDEN